MRSRALLCTAMLMLWVPDARSDPCFDLYQLTDYRHAIEPGIVVDATDTLPRHCAVRGVITGDSGDRIAFASPLRPRVVRIARGPIARDVVVPPRRRLANE